MRRVASLLMIFVLFSCSISSGQKRAAASAPDDLKQFRSLLQQLYDAWAGLDPTRAEKFYAKDPDLTFFDVAPMKYKGWEDYAAGVPKAFSDYQSAKFTVGDDLQVHRHGTFVWGTCTWTADLTKKDGAHENIAGRHTIVWEKRGPEWLVVHEHMSTPLQPPSK